MKKLIGIILVLVMLCALSISAFAGDTPEVVLKEDDQVLFIAIVDDYKKNYDDEPRYYGYDSIKVKVFERIKGNVAVGEVIECKGSLSYEKKPKKGDYYLCHCTNEKDSLFMWAIEEKTGNQIKLLNSEEYNEYDIINRIENYINDGSYAEAEALRLSKLTEDEKNALGENSRSLRQITVISFLSRLQLLYRSWQLLLY